MINVLFLILTNVQDEILLSNTFHSPSLVYYAGTEFENGSQVTENIALAILYLYQCFFKLKRCRRKDKQTLENWL